jgi:DNA polymerase III subunit beta
MKLLCSRQALQEALGLVGSVVSARSPKEILKSVRLSCDQNGLFVEGTDLEVAARAVVNQVEVTEPGEALLPADRVGQLIRESPHESLAIETSELSCVIRGEDEEYKIVGQDPQDFPPIAPFEGEPDFVIKAEVLRDLTEKTSYAAAKESTRYAINGILWERQGESLMMVATDGRRLAKAVGPLIRCAKQPEGADAAEKIQTIVPAKAIGLLNRMLHSGDEEVEVKISHNQLLARTPRAVITSVLVEGHFPKYDDVIPRDCDKKAKLNRLEFMSAIRRAALLTSEESKGVRMEFQDGTLTLTSRSPERGEARIRMVAEYQGDAMAIGFNPYFLVDALKVMNDEFVMFELKEATRPGIVKGEGDFLYLVMPVSLA